MNRFWIALGAANAFLAVAAGAFAAHGLRRRIEADLLAAFETGARYHMFHALGLIMVGLAAVSKPAVQLAGWAMLVGIVLFSGSLYALALTGVRQLGAITPVGGLAFLAGWLILCIVALRAS